MKALLIFFSIFLVVSAEKISKNSIIKAKTLRQIKENAPWVPYSFEENPFVNNTYDDLPKFLGADLKWTHENIMTLTDDDNHSEQENIPEAFDTRLHWPDCITPIRNQEQCGSCWAFSSATALSDRFCIASKGEIKIVLSPQYLVSCDKNERECKGGFLDDTWAFLEKQGVVSDKCFPYKSGNGTFLPTCTNFVLYKVVKGSSKEITCSLQMQKEIMTNGPVQTGFLVYEDFMHYKSGVYKYTQGRKLGGHAVRVIGWGKQDDVNYWIAANTWGSLWGENGFFRIAFGECLFEANGYAGLADSTPASKLFLN